MCVRSSAASRSALLASRIAEAATAEHTAAPTVLACLPRQCATFGGCCCCCCCCCCWRDADGWYSRPDMVAPVSRINVRRECLRSSLPPQVNVRGAAASVCRSAVAAAANNRPDRRGGCASATSCALAHCCCCCCCCDCCFCMLSTNSGGGWDGTLFPTEPGTGIAACLDRVCEWLQVVEWLFDFMKRLCFVRGLLISSNQRRRSLPTKAPGTCVAAQYRAHGGGQGLSVCTKYCVLAVLLCGNIVHGEVGSHGMREFGKGL
jgi:hypothetical protein